MPKRGSTLGNTDRSDLSSSTYGRVAEWSRVAAALVDLWGGRGYSSFDPYDGLGSTWLQDPSRLPRAVRLTLVQLHKRSPLNLRPLFGISPTRNAYADGLFASTQLLLWRLHGDQGRLTAARDLLAALTAERIGEAWGYPFAVQTKTFFYPSSTPNVVSTAFAANAFLDAAKAPGDEAALGIAVAAARFAVRELSVGSEDRYWFGYLPGERSLIHNANLLAARLCVRAGTLADDAQLVEAGVRATLTTLGHQRDDGSFLYGEGPGLDWVDGHHSGFVVECLLEVIPSIPDSAEALGRAADHYRRELFAADGAPRQAPGRSTPIDSIAGAQGILTFAKLGDTHTAERIAHWMIRKMRARGGTFVYQRGRLVTKAVPYARWCDAPMALALAELARAVEAG